VTSLVALLTSKAVHPYHPIEKTRKRDRERGGGTVAWPSVVRLVAGLAVDAGTALAWVISCKKLGGVMYLVMKLLTMLNWTVFGCEYCHHADTVGAAAAAGSPHCARARARMP
jgi:hypothetical protein